MTFSKTTEYIIRILTYMAFCDKELFSARYLHEKLNIPYKYLTNLLYRLSEKGFLVPVQGKYGGYKFLINPKDISIHTIIEHFDGESSLTSCILGLKDCSDQNPCVMHNDWCIVKAQAVEIFKKTTIFDLKKNSGMRITDFDFIKDAKNNYETTFKSKSLDELRKED